MSLPECENKILKKKRHHNWDVKEFGRQRVHMVNLCM